MLKLENISKYYYSSTSVTCALRKINLEFNVGEFVAISGESGSGKTTLLNLISGLDSYEDGEMYFNNNKTSYFDDEDWEKYRKNEIAFIFQNYNLIDSFTVLENVAVSYIIEGYSYKKAKEKAKSVLKLVGLENDYFKKASKLSGGQKQRLSIARALAKETNIIVADEPTGNLDSENGKQVLEILKKLSVDKLVIVVTHNLAQIEPFITRKIRLHDGEVVLDEAICDYKEVESVHKTYVSEERSFKKVLNFSLLNIKSQPKKVLFLMFIILINVLATFIFYANFKSNIDDHKTKMTSNELFTNLDDTRLLVKKKDNSVITDDIRNDAIIDNVKSAEKYDYINDINYYRLGDYKIRIYGGSGDSQDKIIFVDSSFIELVDHSKFMKSYTNLDESMLKAGRLPKDGFEMVVYSNDLSILNKEEVVLFKNDRLWGMDTWYQYNVKIVGILEEPSNQAYFSDDLCKVMDFTKKNIKLSIKYRTQLVGGYPTYSSIDVTKVVIDPNLQGNELSVPEKLHAILSDKDKMLLDKDNLIFTNSNEKITNNYSMNIRLDLKCEIAKDALGVSQEMFDSLYSTIGEPKQFAIFLDDYAYTDDVINELINKEFESLSCFLASVTGYDSNKVNIRYVNLIVSLFGLFGINAVSILLCFTILKVKRNDYVIFKMIGLNNKVASKINYFEIFFYGILSFIILIIISSIVKNAVTMPIILEIYKHIKFYDYIIIFVILFLMLLILGRTFSKFLTKKVKVTVLKED